LELKQNLQATAREMLEGGNFEETVRYDVELKLSELNEWLMTSLEKMEPFGMGNPTPVFLARQVQIKSKPIQVKTSLKFWIQSEGKIFEVFWGGGAEAGLRGGDVIDLYFSLEKNFFRGEESMVLKVKHVSVKGSGK